MKILPLSTLSSLIGPLILGTSLQAQVVTPSRILPPPDSIYISPSTITYPDGIVIRDLAIRGFTQWNLPPVGASTLIAGLSLQVAFQLSVNGGATFTPVTASASYTLRLSNSGRLGNLEVYPIELVGLNIAGDGLSPAVKLRESPIWDSLGRTTITDIGNGLIRIDSGFTVFTEISFDDGVNWLPDLIPAQLVLKGTPQIISQPQSQTVDAGSNATFCDSAWGGQLLSYQWQFNGTNISGATNDCYTRTNAQLADAGSYTVVATDSSGSVTSTVARLSVLTLRIDWFTIGGGGGSSANSALAIAGTIGQPDAGKLSGNSLAIEGGFWGGITAMQMPGAPLLTITRTPTNTVVVSWPSPSIGFLLQQNADLNSANWGTAPEDVRASEDGTTKFIVVNPPVGNRVYRLFKP